MKQDKYQNVISSTDKLEYQFESIGPKGKIKMIVQYSQTDNPEIYNLAFGTAKYDGNLDDVTTNDNKDRNKILATVAATVYEFTSQYPDKSVFFCGSTKERTRLYRMAISLNLEELTKSFKIYGILKGIDTFETLVFKNGTDYFGFLIKRKS